MQSRRSGGEERERERRVKRESFLFAKRSKSSGSETRFPTRIFVSRLVVPVALHCNPRNLIVPNREPDHR